MSDGRGSVFQRLIGFLKRRSPILVLVVGAVAGVLFWGGFNTAMEMTNTMEFCTGCHEMRHTVYQEYKESEHFKNPSGVKATCSDCHVPKTWGHKVVRKIKASTELWHTMLGTIDTPEKFEERRWMMANRVWDSMRESDSRECRNCHDFETMDLSEQDRSARKKHAKAPEQGKTCIDCHQGIAHELPDKPDDAEDEEMAER